MPDSSTLQPNSRHCFVCGLENSAGLRLRFYNTAPGEVTATFTAPEHFQGYPGVVHGGIVAAMLDEALGRAHMGSDGNRRFMYTAKLEIRYRKNVPVGELLQIVGRVGRTKGRTAESQAFILNADGHVLAEASGLLVDVPENTLDSANLEELGWKVYAE